MELTGYYPQYQDASLVDLEQAGDGHNMMITNSAGLVGGQSLDDIVQQNAKAIRRQSMTQQYGPSAAVMDADMRRVSMMSFGGEDPAGPLNDYQFDAPGGLSQEAMMHPRGSIAQSTGSGADRRQSTSGLTLNTNFQGPGDPYNSLLPCASVYQSPLHTSTGLGTDLNTPYMSSAMGMQMDFATDPPLGNMVGHGSTPMNVYNKAPFTSSLMPSPIQQSNSMRSPLQDAGAAGGGDGSRTGMTRPPFRTSHSRSSTDSVQRYSHSQHTPDQIHSHQMQQQRHRERDQNNRYDTAQRNVQGQQTASHGRPSGGGGEGFEAQVQHPTPAFGQDQPILSGECDPLDVALSGDYNPNNQNFSWEEPQGGWPSTMVGRPHMESPFKNAYSSTGFDMLGVLMRVATRSNPEINIGSVDLSCAFVVCDAEKDDIPIVYCSDNFERLTGYTKHMILGRNCRFLQSPDGNVEPGIRRKYVDDASVLYLKNMIHLRREAQMSLINYRRGGQPFMNLLTVIPIPWDTDQVKFFVGFQVDIVEQPNAVTNKNPDGTYSINYQRGLAMPRYVVNPVPENSANAELGQTVSRDDVSAILSTIGTGESEYAKRMWDKVLIENTDDLIHVLSLKGLFQYLSPSSLRVLEYEASELVGTALSAVCHPSDIVPVTRELKDTSTGSAVNVVFRIRRKKSGYMWFEGHGSLHTEQGKGRKCIILVGRERPVYALSKHDIITSGGIGENELWTKMSTSGMFLFVSSNVRQLLDRQPEELVGVSIQSMMRPDSKVEFGRVLEMSRTGKKASVKHEMINKRGQVLQAFTTLYPGDAMEGQKPTFVVAQTRLVKHARGSQARPPLQPKGDHCGSSESAASNTATTGYQASMANSSAGGAASPLSMSRYVTTDGAATTYAGQNGLVLGHQDNSLASEDNVFDELKTTRSSSWQFELRQMERRNRLLAEEVQSLLVSKKKRKRRKGAGQQQKDCANCHTRVTPEWRRGPSGQRDLCNSCGLRWAKLNGRVSPRTGSHASVHSAPSDKASISSISPFGPKSHQSMLGNQSDPATGAAAAQGSMASAAAAIRDANMSSPHHRNSEGHNVSTSAGVPFKIEEGVEPD
ncbi:hypothetical protein LTR50_002257 [Elasticomyces elasticus]|nr:hypothetical protein LTR50_002257 [Elasticomyces elasticus]